MPATPQPLAPPGPHAGRLWDIFCRVIDNHGDLGVCWRLARQLAGEGQRVRLWCDDASALAWMAPQGSPGVHVLPWREPDDGEQPGDVVIEAFGCNPPAAFVERMATLSTPPVWINLEYLSAEDYVERSHGLSSPQFSGPGAGLTKWFFYPGFTSATGGLLREPDIPSRLEAVDAQAVVQRLGVVRRPGERLVSCFCYDARPLKGLFPLLASPSQPLHLLASPGPAQARALALAGQLPNCRATPLPWLDQPGYDDLLASCDLNLVRGEDSVVRALWAGRPFLWQIYPQTDGAHAAKLDAFLRLHLQDESMPVAAESVRMLHRAWNGLGSWPAAPDLSAWLAACSRWRSRLLQQDDLLHQLMGFVRGKAASRPMTAGTQAGGGGADNPSG